MDNLQRTHRLVAEFRRQRIASSWGQDVLQFHTTLWYTWLALSCLDKAFPLADVDMGGGVDSELPTGCSLTSYQSNDPSPMLTDESPVAFPLNDSPGGDSASSSPGVLLLPAVVNNERNNGRDSGLNEVSKRVQRQRQRNILRHRARKRANAMRERPPKAGHDIHCPSRLCRGKFSQCGVIDHL
jgi:hypothetical protein